MRLVSLLRDRLRSGATRRRRWRVTGALGICALAVAVGCVLAVSSASGLGTCNDNWQATGDGDWNVGSNWSAGLPGTNSVACWPTTVTVTIDSAATADSIQGGSLAMTVGSLTLKSTANSSTVGDLSITAGSITGTGAQALAVTGNFAWNPASSSEISSISITQSGGGSFSIGGSAQAELGFASISSSSPVSITNLGFVGNSGSLTTTGPVTLATGTYATGPGGSLPLTAGGIVTSGAVTAPDYALDVTGNSSALGGSLSAAGFGVGAGGSVTVPDGDTVTSGFAGGTIAGTISGSSGTFALTGNAYVTASSGSSLTMGHLNVGGALTVASGATFAPTGGTSVSGSLTVNAANAATGDFTVQGGASISGSGTLAVSGNFDWAPTGSSYWSGMPMTQSGGGSFTIGGTAEADLQTTLSTTSPVSISNTSFVGTGSLTTTSTTTFATGTYSTGPGGSLPLTAAGFVTSGTVTLPDYALHVTGNSTSLGGSLSAAGLNVPAGASVLVPNGDVLTTGFAGGTIAGAITGAGGTFAMSGNGVVTLSNGSRLTTDQVTVGGGTLTVASGATFAPAGGTTVSGAITINATNATTGNLTVQGGATISGTGALAVNGSFDWTPTAFSAWNALPMTQSGGGSFTIGGSAEAELLAPLTTSSPVSITNTSFVGNGGSLTTTSTTMLAAGTYSTGPSTALPLSAAGFVLSGTAAMPDYDLVQTGGTTVIPGGTTDSAAQLTLQGGTLTVTGTLTAPVTASAGTMTGSGTVSGSVTNSGATVGASSSSATLAISGNYSQSNGGTLLVPVHAASAGHYGVVTVGGTVSLGGTLEIAPDSTYQTAASEGDTLGVVVYSGTETGTFGTVTVTPPLPAGNPVTADYSHTGTVDAVVGAGPAGPTVTGVSPSAGPAAGGTTVTITGPHLTGATAVKFGSTAAASFTVNGNGTITAVSPAGSGTVDITVTSPAGTSSTSDLDTFTFDPVPEVTQISPSVGPAAGGTAVTATGTGFTADSTVSFGTTAAAITSVTPTSITATSPAGTGTVNVTVTTPGGTSASAAADEFTYFALPTVTAISPAAGPATGGTKVTVTGTGLTGATAVSFGGTAATQITVAPGGTSLSATSPAGTGTVDVTVTTPGGTSATSSADQFTFTPPPTVTGVRPAAGPIGGVTTVTITGDALTGATGVSFGTKPATNVTVNSGGTSITATSPAASGAGPVDVTVITPGGTSAASTADEFTYTAAPIVTAVSPGGGPIAGGTIVTITGTSLTGASAVEFGGTAARGFTVNGSGTSITATAPSGSGTVDVAVTTPGGTSATSSADKFTFFAVPAITAESPLGGPTAGGTQVTITGTGFTGATAVDFGSTAAASFTVVNDTTITATSPPGTGQVNLSVTAPGGTSAPSSSTYSYINPPTVSSISPATGLAAGGTTVTITGTNFVGSEEQVSFGGTAATNVTVNSPTSITATTPAGNGTVDVVVTDILGDSSPTSSADKFTFVGVPTVTGVLPPSGGPNGGTQVRITGTGFTGATSVSFKWFNDICASGGCWLPQPTAATSFSVIDDDTIILTTPKVPEGDDCIQGSPDPCQAVPYLGPVDIIVTSPGGTSSPSASDQFDYVGSCSGSGVTSGQCPVISSISPQDGPAAGGTTVTITGESLPAPGDGTVQFGGSGATLLTWKLLSTVVEQITVRTPPSTTIGLVPVEVANHYGTTTVPAADGFTYLVAPTVTAVSPAFGKTAGGQRVMITGTGFRDLDGNPTVKFGSAAATSVAVYSTVSMSAVAPAGRGAVNVTVTTDGGTSKTSAADVFDYSQTGLTFGTTAGAAPVNGAATVREPAARKAVPLTRATTIPVGSTVNADHATVELCAASGPGSTSTQCADFSGGTFEIVEDAHASAARAARAHYTDLKLVAPLPCSAGGRTVRRGNAARSRHLSADGPGAWRIDGLYADVAARAGGHWQTTDTCSSTTVTVKQGSVTVDDVARHTTVRVTAGHKYRAAPRT